MSNGVGSCHGFAAHSILARGNHADETATQAVVVSVEFGTISAGAETWLQWHSLSQLARSKKTQPLTKPGFGPRRFRCPSVQAVAPFR